MLVLVEFLENKIIIKRQIEMRNKNNPEDYFEKLLCG